MCPAADGEEIGFVVTPEGEAWLREFPADMLALYADSAGTRRT
ncbi:MAG: hypothetical protein ACYC2H_04325 [Thermoplasmatota archaeon]